jgi:DNA-directed RNA polymerase subunit M/transcription elongation factor TFIIS
MNKFCNYCNNLLYTRFSNDELLFTCMSCYINFPYNESDTLRYSRTKENNVVIFEKILYKAVDDPSTLKKNMECVKCDNNIVKQVRIGSDMKLFNICTKCKTQWLN